MEIFCSLPVPRSLALTWRMPLASMSKVTSICGTPRGAGGIPSRWKLPNRLVVTAQLAFALKHMNLHSWLIVAEVEKDLAISESESWYCAQSSRSKRRRAVSIASESGVTSSRSTSFTSPLSTPPWMHAPTATTSSGFTPLCGSLLTSDAGRLDNLRHARHATDQHQLIDVFALHSASFKQSLTGLTVRSNRSSSSCSIFARVSFF